MGTFVCSELGKGTTGCSGGVLFVVVVVRLSVHVHFNLGLSPRDS